jgi:hypothetical protein
MVISTHDTSGWNKMNTTSEARIQLKVFFSCGLKESFLICCNPVIQVSLNLTTALLSHAKFKDI